MLACRPPPCAPARAPRPISLARSDLKSFAQHPLSDRRLSRASKARTGGALASHTNYTTPTTTSNAYTPLEATWSLMVYFDATDDGSLMRAPASGRGALDITRSSAPLTGSALRLRAPPAGGHGAECPRFWAGGFGRPNGGAPYEGRRASPCPSNGGVAGVWRGEML